MEVHHRGHPMFGLRQIVGSPQDALQCPEILVAVAARCVTLETLIDLLTELLRLTNEGLHPLALLHLFGSDSDCEGHYPVVALKKKTVFR